MRLWLKDNTSGSDSSDRDFDKSLQSGLNTEFMGREKRLKKANDYYLTTKI